MPRFSSADAAIRKEGKLGRRQNHFFRQRRRLPAPSSSDTRRIAASIEIPDSTQISIRSSASGQARLIECWRLSIAVGDEDVRRVEADIGDPERSAEMRIGSGLSARWPRHEDPRRPPTPKKTNGSRKRASEEHVQRILRTKAGGAQFVHGVFVDQRLAQVELLDDLADRSGCSGYAATPSGMDRHSCARVRGRGSARARWTQPSCACRDRRARRTATAIV